MAEELLLASALSGSNNSGGGGGSSANQSKPWLAPLIWGVVIVVVLLILVIGGYFLYKYLKQKVDPGQPCSTNSDCKNDTCGKSTYADNAPYICCPSGNIDTYLATDYCTGMPDCAVCRTNTMCAGGKCANNEDGPGNCSARSNAPVGACCGIDSDCNNNACGRTSLESSIDYCCASGKTVRRSKDSRDYCTDLPDGTSCFTDTMCMTGKSYCKIPDSETTGICTAKQAPGTPCPSGENHICAGPPGTNGACSHSSYDPNSPLVCCPSGESVYDSKTVRNYCTGIADNNACGVNSMCKSGACGFQQARTPLPQICCISGEEGTYPGDFRDYCLGLPHGQYCFADMPGGMCAAGLTCNNGNGGIGLCLNPGEKLPANSGCSANGQCTSGACGRLVDDKSAPTYCCESGPVQHCGTIAWDFCPSVNC